VQERPRFFFVLASDCLLELAPNLEESLGKTRPPLQIELNPIKDAAPRGQSPTLFPERTFELRAELRPSENRMQDARATSASSRLTAGVVRASTFASSPATLEIASTVTPAPEKGRPPRRPVPAGDAPRRCRGTWGRPRARSVDDHAVAA
jgi:hypothetical protein